MNNQFVTYEITLKLKELGFDEECFGFYEEDGLEIYGQETKRKNLFNETHIEAPLWQQTITWIENVYNITIEIYRNKYFDTFMKSWAYQALIKVFNETELTTSYFVRDKMNNTIFYSYEDAREQAILKALELCQKEK